MILNIGFKNYRSFKDLVNFSMIAEPSKSKSKNVSNITIGKGDKIRLLNVATIFGANASGKSTLLRGMYEISRFIVNKDITVGSNIEAYDPFAFFEETKIQPVEFTIDFIIDKIKYTYSIAFTKKNILNEKLIYFPNNKSVDLFHRHNTDNAEIVTHHGIIGSKSKNKKIEIFHNQTILSKFGSDIPDEITSLVFLYFKDLSVINAVNSGMLSSYNKVLKKECDEDKAFFTRINEIIKFVDTGINKLSLSKADEEEFKFPDDFSEDLKSKIIEDNKYKLVSLHNYYKNEELIRDNEPFPFNEESHGTKKLFTLSGVLLRAIDKGQPIFIDEFETSLHPFLSKTLISLFQNKKINKKNAQLIISTQDSNLFDRYLLRKDQIWLTEKDKYGKTDLFSLQDFSDVREDTPFEKWYLAGKFGALPKIKSIESLFIE
jgi:AAA15 family ATPase/GTPase